MALGPSKTRLDTGGEGCGQYLEIRGFRATAIVGFVEMARKNGNPKLKVLMQATLQIQKIISGLGLAVEGMEELNLIPEYRDRNQVMEVDRVIKDFREFQATVANSLGEYTKIFEQYDDFLKALANDSSGPDERSH